MDNGYIKLDLFSFLNRFVIKIFMCVFGMIITGTRGSNNNVYRRDSEKQKSYRSYFIKPIDR